MNVMQLRGYGDALSSNSHPALPFLIAAVKIVQGLKSLVRSKPWLTR